ncbi:tetratricopeptide repeat protein [Candidatus Poribacteria bacterium]|nr:tetratricopeptide repeat protein [Candidatus Poribacteria bacterium]
MAKNKRPTKEEIQEDKFINLVLACYGFLKDNARTICITLAVGIVAVAAYTIYTQNQEREYAEASADFNDARKISKEAETNFFDTTPPEDTEDDTDDPEEKKASFEDSEEKLKAFLDKYPNVAYTDKARYNYAKNLYYQGKYPEARAEFETVIETHKPENEIYALYAQKAVGNCYEQEGKYEEAISAYEEREFPKTTQLPQEIRQYVLSNAKLNQALCYEKINAMEDAKAAYQEIIDDFKQALEIAIQKKSQDLIKEAKEVLKIIEEPLNLQRAENLESEQLYYKALVEYTDTIRTYKVQKDIKGGLPEEVRKRIRSFEDVTTTLMSNIQDARNHEKSDSISNTLYYYNAAVEFEKFGFSRELYEKALLNYNRLAATGTGGRNE